MIVVWSFFREAGHLSFDHPWIASVFPWRQFKGSEVFKQPLIVLVMIFGFEHLELRDGVTDQFQGIDKADPIGIPADLYGGIMDDVSDQIMGDEQAIELLDDADRSTTSKGSV